MKTTLMSTAAAALLLGIGAAQAMPIDLAGLGFAEGTPVYAGEGGVFYDDFDITLSTDVAFEPFVLDDFADADVIMEFDGLGFGFGDVAGIEYFPGGDFENFDIVATGDNGGDTLEFLLELVGSDLSGGTTGLGADAILRVTSRGFDFSVLEPLDYFADNVDGFGEFAADVTFSFTSLSVPAVPLPATLPMILAGMGSLAWLRRRAS